MKRLFFRFVQCWLRYVCSAYVRRNNPFVIGVTGSVGKSTCRTLVAQTLVQILPGLTVYSSPKNFNGELGLFLSVMKIESFSPSFGSFLLILWKSFFLFFRDLGVDVYVLEYGIDRPGEMGELVGAIAPNVAIVTVIDAVHVANFTNIDHIAAEKGLLVASAKELAILNVDDARVAAMSTGTDIDTLWYSFIGGERSQLRVDDFHVSVFNGVDSSFTACMGKIRYPLHFDRWSHYDAVYVTMGLALADFLAPRYKIHPVPFDSLTFHMLPGRATLLSGVRDSLMYDSSYNASPESMLVALREACYLHSTYFSHYFFCLLLGEMRELGASSYHEHKLLLDRLVKIPYDTLCLVGSEWLQFSSNLAKLPGFHGVFASSRKAGDCIRKQLEAGDTPYFVFVKGSQNTIYLEEAIKKLLSDPSDASLLARQEEWWLKKKELYFSSLDGI